MNRTLPQTVRTLLVLGRVSNLPTVWSNCLAGWWLSGGGNFWKLPFLLAGMSALYTGGMFLNDAFDEQFDRQRRSARPIPSGAIPPETVWRFGWGWLALGTLCLMVLGKVTSVLTLMLVLSVLIFNLVHKFVTVSPWLMGLCRFWVYVIAGTTGAWGLNGWPIACGAVLAFYVAGLSYITRRDDYRRRVPYWQLLLLAAPIGLALLMNTGAALKPGLIISLMLVIWVARSIRTVFAAGGINVSQTLSGLLAGIVLVDWLAVAPLNPTIPIAILFVGLFGLTLLLQQFVPAS